MIRMWISGTPTYVFCVCVVFAYCLLPTPYCLNRVDSAVTSSVASVHRAIAALSEDALQLIFFCSTERFLPLEQTGSDRAQEGPMAIQ